MKSMNPVFSVLGVLLTLSASTGCAARFYGGTPLPPDRLMRLVGNPELYEIRINNRPTGLFHSEEWILLPGPNVVAARYASAKGWGGAEPAVLEFVGRPGHRYVLRAALADSAAAVPGSPGDLRNPARLVKWRLWVEDLDTHERPADE